MTVETFFNLTREPFSIAPDPRFLYLSSKHREALVLLDLGLTRGASFVLLTGEIGAGKTTVWRHFLEKLPSNVDVASVVNPKLGVEALVARVCEDLQVPPAEPGTAVDQIDRLHGHLLLAHAQGRRTLIVIDEAQALSTDVLEQLRLLTNLDSSGKKLQVMLIAQPEMQQILARPELEPLAQRIVARYHLPALSEAETASYIAHRLQVAGWHGPVPFDGESLGLVHHLCRGVPRRINVLCDRAMNVAVAAGQRRIGREFIEKAAIEAFGSTRPPAAVAGAAATPGAEGTVPPRRLPRAAPALAGVAVLALGAGVWLGPRLVGTPSAPAPAVMAAAPVPPAPAPAAAPALPPPPPAEPPAVVQAVVAEPPKAVEPPPRAPGPEPLALPARVQPPLPALARVAVLNPSAPPVPRLPDMQPPIPSGPAGLLAEAFGTPSGEEAPALRQLASMWGETLGGADACAAAPTAQLQCYRGRGGLAMLRQIDRPAVLRLSDDRGRTAHVLLLGMPDDQHARVAIAGNEQSLPLSELAKTWRGDFVTLWRSPPGWRESDPAASAAWLVQQLGRVDGQASFAGGETVLRSRLFAFQLSQGLPPDGRAEPVTLMLLNKASGVSEPRLAGRS